MFRVSLLPGEMTRDVCGIRPTSITLKYGTWIEMNKTEVDSLLSDPLLAPRLSIIEVPEPKQVTLKQPVVKKAKKV